MKKGTLLRVCTGVYVGWEGSDPSHHAKTLASWAHLPHWMCLHFSVTQRPMSHQSSASQIYKLNSSFHPAYQIYKNKHIKLPRKVVIANGISETRKKFIFCKTLSGQQMFVFSFHSFVEYISAHWIVCSSAEAGIRHLFILMAYYMLRGVLMRFRTAWSWMQTSWKQAQPRSSITRRKIERAQAKCRYKGSPLFRPLTLGRPCGRSVGGGEGGYLKFNLGWYLKLNFNLNFKYTK
jgi:hypothetical protein